MSLVTVSSSSELLSALSSARGGETIVLAPGSYGDLQLSGKLFASEVVIVSGDPEAKSTFRSIKLNDVSNLTFTSVEVKFVPTAATIDSSNAVEIRDSHNIQILDSALSGAPLNPGEPPTGRALGVYGSTDFAFVGNEISQFHKGVTLSNVNGALIKQNEVHDLRTTPLNGGNVNNVLIEDNHFHSSHPVNFGGAGDHGDHVHFWIQDGQAGRNIVIQNNFFEQGTGTAILGVFLEDNGSNDGLGYSDVVIRNNVIFNGHRIGVLIENGNGILIEKNTLLQSSGDPNDGPTILLYDGTRNAIVRDNVLSNPLDLETGTSAISEAGTVHVQAHDPSGPNYIGDLLSNPFARDLSLSDLRVMPGSVLNQLGAGSTLLQFDAQPDTMAGFVLSTHGSGLALLSHHFDASLIFNQLGGVDTQGASVTWDYGDGTISTGGITSSHTYAKAGEYDVSAVVTLKDGQVLTLDKTVAVQSPVALRADFTAGAIDLSDTVNAVTVGSAATFEAGQDGKALRLNGDAVRYATGPEFFNNSEYTVQFDFKKDAGAELASGRVINFSGSFMIALEADGLYVSTTTSAGAKTLQARGLGIADGDWHKVTLTFSGQQGTAVLYLDGQEVARATGLEGGVQTGINGQDFTLGDPFGGTSFPGLIDNVQFVRGVNTSDPTSPLNVPGQGLPPVQSGDGAIPDAVYNLIQGYDADDTLIGTAGMDRLVAGRGNDILNGGDGNDVLLGGHGNDIYIINRIGDVVIETGGFGRGFDTVESSISYTLSDNVDRVVLTGAQPLNANGNFGANIIIGNEGANEIAGGAGADKLDGGGGADIFRFTAETDSTNEDRDLISNFTTEDQIDLSLLDANAATAGNQAFGIATSLLSTQKSAGSLYLAPQSGGERLAYLNTDSDSTFEVVIRIQGMITTADFNL